MTPPEGPEPPEVDLVRRLPDALVTPVTQFATRIVSVPLSPTIVTRHYTITTIEMVLVRASDDDRCSGVATLWCFGLRQARVLQAAVEYVAEHAMRHGDRDISTVLSSVRREINFFGYKGVSVFALSAIDMALTDLACRQWQVSLGDVLGRRRDRVPAYWSGLFGNQSLAEIVTELDQKLEEGFRAFKLRLGSVPLADDLRRLEAAMDRLPSGTTLMVDAVQSWTRSDALAAVDALSGYPLRWIEDPVVHDDYEALAEIASRSTVPIATGENEYLCAGFEQVLDAGATVLLADLERTGGIREWLSVAELASRRGAVLTPHVYPHISMQLCAALPQDEVWIEHLPWWDALTGVHLMPADGAFTVPRDVGAGLTLVDELVEAHSITDWLAIEH